MNEEEIITVPEEDIETPIEEDIETPIEEESDNVEESDQHEEEMRDYQKFMYFQSSLGVVVRIQNNIQLLCEFRRELQNCVPQYYTEYMTDIKYKLQRHQIALKDAEDALRIAEQTMQMFDVELDYSILEENYSKSDIGVFKLEDAISLTNAAITAIAIVIPPDVSINGLSLIDMVSAYHYRESMINAMQEHMNEQQQQQQSTDEVAESESTESESTESESAESESVE